MGESPRSILEFTLRTLEFTRTAGKARPGEHEDVLVNDQVPGLAAGAGLADVVELEERRPGDQVLAPQAREQRAAARAVTARYAPEIEGRCS
jgi:hypothetical protein